MPYRNGLRDTWMGVATTRLEATVPAPSEAKAIANFFLRRQRLTQMRLHRLVYYAHGSHVGLSRGTLSIRA